MNLVIITLAHGETSWWDSIPAALELRLPIGTVARFSPDNFPPEIAVTKKKVQAGPHQIFYWTYTKFHGQDRASGAELKAEIERRAKLIYRTVWKDTPCMANDAIIVHEVSFPDVVVTEACWRSRYYVYGGAVDDFARAAYEGRVENKAFMDFTEKFLTGQIDLVRFKGIHPEIAHYFNGK